uniref:Uncharacterized protein n=1 Tax=Globisporangium ultimum (strain ATCC 200006 / CBS 805.95 / DAOM BR144) TaxID=431595 RepID=K3W8M7_GLOUD
MPATLPIPPIRPTNEATEYEQQQQQQQRSVNANAFALRKQFEAKLVSLQRGMEHVQHCRAGDACGSSLCHSTRRLMHTYQSHQCPPAPSATASIHGPAAECKVCKLWDFLMTRRTQMAAIAHLRRPLTQTRDAFGSSSSCRIQATGARRRSASSVHSRIVAAQHEAHHLSARCRF